MLRRRSSTRSTSRPLAATPPGPKTSSTSRPEPPRDARNLVIVILDSLRYDVWAEAEMPNLERIGPVERRWSYASWTAPSHYNLLMGLVPHGSPAHVFASEQYKAEFRRFNERLGLQHIEFRSFLPDLWLPSFLHDRLGYGTQAFVSMPVLNPAAPLNRGFDTYELMAVHNDMKLMIDQLSFEADRPTFTLLNVGETHYPYALPGEDATNWPRISGMHGVLKHLDDEADASDRFFTDEELADLRQRQVRAASYVDTVLGQLFERLPSQSWLIVTSDHGELFGEAGYFGHGPISHEKVLEVPFVEGLVP